MSKPLELTIYPRPIMKAHHQGPAPYLDMESGTLTSEHAANMLAGAKRLTEAELAAEYWAQVHDSQYAMTCELAAEYKQGREAAKRWGAQSTAKATTLHRFATHPHYFEATEPESDTE